MNGCVKYVIANNTNYSDYGGRGITMCKRYHYSFLAFYEDMGQRPEGMSLDRENTNGNYSCGKCEECQANGCKANCRWATLLEQATNQRRRKDNTSGYFGVSKKPNGWIAYINHAKKRYWLGTFATSLEAARAYNVAALKLHGSSAKLNTLPS